MKKIIAVGIIAILTLSLTGCNWFQSTEPAVEQPTVTEESDTTVAVPYVYENAKYGFSLTFPVTWGIVTETESAQPTIVKLTSKQDSDRYIQIYVSDAANTGVNDAPITFLEKSDKYAFYFDASGDCYGKPGCEDVKYKTMLDESIEISKTFKLI